MREKKLINKKVKKKVDGKCQFCAEADYALLDVHRIIEGADGGKYTDYNTVTVCCRCHRRIHDKQIVILGKHFTTNGRWLVRYEEDGEEKFA